MYYHCKYQNLSEVGRNLTHDVIISYHIIYTCFIHMLYIFHIKIHNNPFKIKEPIDREE